ACGAAGRHGGDRGQWARWLGVGVLAPDALVSGDEEVRAAMPVEVAVGVAVELGLGLTAAADYIVPGVGNWEEAGWRSGLEGRFGRRSEERRVGKGGR